MGKVLSRPRPRFPSTLWLSVRRGPGHPQKPRLPPRTPLGPEPQGVLPAAVWSHFADGKAELGESEGVAQGLAADGEGMSSATLWGSPRPLLGCTPTDAAGRLGNGPGLQGRTRKCHDPCVPRSPQLEGQLAGPCLGSTGRAPARLCPRPEAPSPLGSAEGTDWSVPLCHSCPLSPHAWATLPATSSQRLTSPTCRAPDLTEHSEDLHRKERGFWNRTKLRDSPTKPVTLSGPQFPQLCQEETSS